VDPSKNSVDGFVAVSVFPPAFHNPGVVSMDKDIATNTWDRGKGISEEFETNGLSPSDVLLSIEGLPTWY